MIENSHPVLENFERLPAATAEASWLGQHLSIEPVAARNRRILLVEDDESLRGCLRMILELAGHQVTEAANGAEALNLFRAGEFDLVITDFEMPVMQGNTLAIGIKLSAPSLPVLMITASERARRGATNPVDALLNKPFTVDELQRALERLWSTRPEPDQASAVQQPGKAALPA